MTASLLGAALLSALARAGGWPASPLETNLAQTTATAVGVAPAAAGLLGAIPALALLGHSVPGWLVAAWGLALVLAAVLVGVCARAAGQTDISPAGEVGYLSQVAGGLAGGTTAAASAGLRAVVAGAASQAAVSLWALEAGRELGASPRRQAVGLLAGTAVGAQPAAPAYLLLTSAHAVSTAALPVPDALPWKALAEAAGGGLVAIPPGAALAAGLALGAGAALELLGRTRAARWLPAPGALGMGFIVPAQYAVTLAAGALAGEAWRAFRPARADEVLLVAGAGAIAGESLAAVVVAAMTVARRLGP